TSRCCRRPKGPATTICSSDRRPAAAGSVRQVVGDAGVEGEDAEAVGEDVVHERGLHTEIRHHLRDGIVALRADREAYLGPGPVADGRDRQAGQTGELHWPDVLAADPASRRDGKAAGRSERERDVAEGERRNVPAERESVA